MAKQIFINYRRGLNRKDAQHLHTQLQRHFPKKRLFIDEKGLDNAPDWLHELERQVANSEIMLALIGAGWADVRNERGERRLDDRNDFVRFEISEAIRREIPIIPVRIDNAAMPEIGELPPDMWLLTRPQASFLRSESFDGDADKIAERIRKRLRKPGGVAPWAAGALALAALAGGIAAGPRVMTALGLSQPVAPGPVREWVERAEAAKKDAESKLGAALRERDEARTASSAAQARLELAQAGLIPLQRRAEAAEAEAAKLKDEPRLRAAAEKARDEARSALAAAQTKVADLERQVEVRRVRIEALEKELAAERTKKPAAEPPPGTAGRKPVPLSAREEAALRPKETFRECEGCPEMVVVAGGAFDMGSPQTEKDRLDNEDDTPGAGGKQVRVTIAKFAVGKFEVTFDEWEACVAGGGCQTTKAPGNENWGRLTRPVINVSWNNAQEYVTWLNGKAGVTRKYRLLTEAEWEYAARGGESTRYSWGDDIGKNRANCDGCGSQWDNKQTAPVGQFAPNAYGLYDMHGNVWEWVQDCYADSYKDLPRDGKAHEATGSCGIRVLRGGAWNDYPRDLRAADRGGVNPAGQYANDGFRLARTLN